MGISSINEHLLKGIVELGISELQREDYSFSRGNKDVKHCISSPGKYILDLEYLDVFIGEEYVGDIDIKKITSAINNSSEDIKTDIFGHNWDAATARHIILSAMTETDEEEGQD